MPLLDHFHPPLHGPRRWEGFNLAWATSIAQQLNQDTLPSDYYAESEISVGPELEIDVATMEQVDKGNRNKVFGTGIFSPPRAKICANAELTPPDTSDCSIFQALAAAGLRA